jgi:hypothetical protein
MSKDPLLVWYTQKDCILTAEERDIIIAKLQTDGGRKQLRDKSKGFWFKETHVLQRL